MTVGITPEAPFSYESVLQPNTHMDFRFKLSATEARDLAALLASALEGSEVLLRLPAKEMEVWAIYWKLREGDSRALFAHPEKGEFVATVSLEHVILERTLHALRAGESFKIESFCALGGFSNLHIEFEVS